MSNVTRLDPNGPEPVTVLEVALEDVDDFAEVIVIAFRKKNRRSFTLYASKGVEEVRFAHAAFICQDTAMKFLNEQVEQDF